MEIWKTDENFRRFCRFMFEENCIERWECGQTLYEDAESYTMKNLDYLENRYRQQAQTESEWSRSIYLR